MRTLQKSCLFALAAAALVAGCSQILGLKDPDLDNPGPGIDATIDTPVAIIDGRVVDGRVIDGPPIDARPIDGPSCDPVACKFGCEADGVTCRPAKLWVFPSRGAFLGNRFGGQATPAAVRATADALCFDTVAIDHPTLQCKKAQVHVVLEVSPADSLGLMATSYSIPTTAPVHRADDDVLVSNGWNDLIDTTKSPRQPVTTATGDQALVWSGAASGSACSTANGNWTTEVSTVFGVRGDSSLTSSNWLARGSQACSLLARLLCVCWTVPE